MNEPMVAGLFGLLGVLVGALLQFWFDRRSNQESRYLELKSEACADYVNSIAAVAFASAAERSEALEKVAAAKGRLCVFVYSEHMSRIRRNKNPPNKNYTLMVF